MFKEEQLKQALNGDLQSVEEICSATWEVLYRFIYYRVQNRQEAEDITQETYVKALAHCRGNSAAIDNFIGLLKTIALNILRDQWRRTKRRGISVDFEAIDPGKTAVADLAEAGAQRASIEKGLNSLSEEQRRVIELRIIKGYSTAETAKIMHKKAGTIRVLQYRALQALAAILGNDLS